MIRVQHFSGATWGIRSSNYSPALRLEARATPGLEWQPAASSWVGYADAVFVCVARMRARGIRIEGDVVVDDTTTTMPIATQGLHDYQKEGVSFLVAHAAEGGLLADDGGLGKTAQTLRAMRALKQNINLVVCPSFVRGVWEREAAKWWPSAHVVLLSGTKPEKQFPSLDLRDNVPTLYVIHYDIVHAWIGGDTPAALLDTVVDFVNFDEAHALVNERSRRSQACKEIARHAKYRTGTTGTPMTNRPKDLWNIVDTLSEGRFGKPFPFFLRHCDAHKEEVAKDKVVWKMDGASNLDELHARMKFFMLRRTKSDVALQLPAHTRQIVEVDVKRECVIKPSVAMQDDKMLRRALDLAADGKITDVVALVEGHVAEGRKVVVFTHRRAVAEAICDMCRAFTASTAFVTGDVPQKRRDAIFASKPDVLAATIDSTLMGIDLTYADVDVFAELSWEPWKLTQAEWRLHRQGQRKPVLSQFVIGRGTIDEIISATVIAKLAAFEQTIGKLDDKLRQDFSQNSQRSAVEQLKSLYDRLLADG